LECEETLRFKMFYNSGIYRHSDVVISSKDAETSFYSPRMYWRRIMDLLYGPKERPSRVRL